MQRLKIGIMGCSEFAGRAMIPAMQGIPEIEIFAIASRDKKKAQGFASKFKTLAVEGYKNLLAIDDIDVIYMPLPTGYHEEWITRSLEAGKHILVEKSFAPDWETAKRLTELARHKKLLMMENFLFPHHLQYRWICERLNKGDIGNVSVFRSNFSIPKLNPDNFRYNALAGGGALFDLGAYLVKFSRLFLGDDLKLVGATLRHDKMLGVDMAGTATFINMSGQISQIAFDLDSFYQNNWEFFGKKGKIVTERAFTAPPGFNPVVRIEKQNYQELYTLPSDNHYVNKIKFFLQTIFMKKDFGSHWDELEKQAYYLDLIRREAVKL